MADSVRLTHPGGGGVVLELPMVASVFGRALQLLGGLGFELVDDGGDVEIGADNRVRRG